MQINFFPTILLPLFLLFPSCGFCQEFTHGTIVVAARNDKEIVLGADSKQNSFDYTSSSQTCKVKIVGNKAVSLAGLRSSLLPGKGVVDFLDIATNTCLVGSLTECADKFTGKMVEILKYVAPKMKEIAPVEFSKHTGNQGLVSVLFCGFESGVPTVIKRDFNVQDSTAGLSLDVNQEIFNSGTGVRAIGETVGATRYSNANPKLLSSPLLSIVRNLIESELTASPALVGRPISIVRVTRGGATWIEPGECQNNAQQKPSKPAKKRVRDKTSGK